MTDKEALYLYRMKQAEETMIDAESMLKQGLAPRSIINRVYYAIFYSVLALFIDYDIQPGSSKHTRIISLFDREFIATEILDKSLSKAFHKAIDARQEGDYKEFAEFSIYEAGEYVSSGEHFLAEIKKKMKI